MSTVPAWSSRYLLPVGAGMLFVLGLAPFDLWPAIPVSAGILCWRLHHDSARSAFLTGWLYGTGLFGAGASWIYVSIHVYGHAAPPLALLLTAVFCCGLALLYGLQSLCYHRFFSGKHWTFPALGFPALWVLFEWLRSWLLTGFPWLYAGYASLETPLAGWAPVTGVFGLSFWLVALGSGTAGLVSSLGHSRRHVSAWLLSLLAIGIAGLGLSGVEWTKTSGTALSVALYQPNIPLKDKWNPRYRKQILDQYELASKDLYTNTDLILWPESALPAFRDTLSTYLSRANQRARDTDTTLITGIPTRTATGLHNSIIALGLGSGEYAKQKLVPFGEYVPLEYWLRGLIQFFNLPMSQFVPGPPVQPRLQAGSQVVAPFICYEVVYPGFVSQGARGANLLVTVSNDSWFGDSIGPLQHLQMARYRALETGRPMLRGTNNGVSAIIDHRGRIRAASDQFVEATVQGQIQPRAGVTPFMQFGSWPVLALSLAVLVILRRHASKSN